MFMELKLSPQSDIIASGGTGFPDDQCRVLCESKEGTTCAYRR